MHSDEIAADTEAEIGHAIGEHNIQPFGLDKGVKRLSELNMGLAGMLLLFILIAGPTLLILYTFVTSLIDYLYYLPQLSNWMGRSDTSFLHGWTTFYWAWWIAWFPFQDAGRPAVHRAGVRIEHRPYCNFLCNLGRLRCSRDGHDYGRRKNECTRATACILVFVDRPSCCRADAGRRHGVAAGADYLYRLAVLFCAAVDVRRACEGFA